MDVDGSNKKQVTNFGAASWAPYYLPSMKWIVFASNLEDPNKYEFDVYAIRPDGSELTRLTFAPGFDGLPVPSPDGQHLMWTSNRVDNKSHVFIADLTLPDIDAPSKSITTIPPGPPVDRDTMEKRDRAAAEAQQNTLAHSKELADASREFRVEHAVAKLFHRAGLTPFG